MFLTVVQAPPLYCWTCRAGVLDALPVADAIGTEVVGVGVEDSLALLARDAAVRSRGGAGVDALGARGLGPVQPRVEVGLARGVEALAGDDGPALLGEFLGEVVGDTKTERLLVVPDRDRLQAERVIREVAHGGTLEGVVGGDTEVVVLAGRPQGRGGVAGVLLAVVEGERQTLVR